MRIAFLGKRHSIHAVRWVNALAERGHEVHLLSSVHFGEPLNPHVCFHPLPVPPPAGFFANAITVGHLLRRLRPEVLNTHFASGYGTLARLSGFRPNVLSVWGSDVYEFPFKSRLHRKLIEANLKEADIVCSTSKAMARQTLRIAQIAHLRVIPFGIDTNVFAPAANRPGRPTITVGTVKTLGPKYGVDLLIKAFGQLRNKLQSLDPEVAGRLRLVIVGGGPDARALQSLAIGLGLENFVRFTGPVPHEEVPRHLATLDIYVALSRFESFGVAVLEASACELPVVVSDVGGLPEVVVPGETGLVVPRNDPLAAATALEKLVLHWRLRTDMGSRGREYVRRRYAWERCIDLMESAYRCAIHCR